MIALAYIFCIAYVLGLIFLVGPLVQRFSNVETSRKAIHILLFGEWILIDCFLKNTVHQIIIPVIFIVLNTLSYKFKLYKSVEREEDNHFGTIYFAIAITVLLTLAYFRPEFYMPAGIATLCLTFGDGFAALIGYNFKSRKIKESKSLLGFIACAVATFVALTIFNCIYNVSLGIWNMIVISLFAAILELSGNGLDNFTVSFGILIIGYCLMSWYSSALIISLAIAAIIFLIVFLAKSIDYPGACLAMFMVFAFGFFGKAAGLTYFLLAYFAIFAVSLIKKKSRRKTESSMRGFKQILINGGMGTLFVILYGVLGNKDFLILSIIAIGGCFVDSVASDVGAFAKGDAYDPIRRTRVEKGLSGGVSRTGSLAALIASVLIAVYTYCFVAPQQVFLCVFVFVMCMLQTSVDTVLGSVMQVKYKCPLCGTVTEKKLHCDVPAEKCAGLAWVDNNMVNALSTLGISLISFVCMVVI